MIETALLDSQKPELQVSDYYTDQTLHIPEPGNYPMDTTQNTVRAKWNAVQKSFK